MLEHTFTATFSAHISTRAHLFLKKKPFYAFIKSSINAKKKYMPMNNECVKFRLFSLLQTASLFTCLESADLQHLLCHIK